MHPTTSSPHEREQRFREVYDAAYVDVLRFVRRRVPPPDLSSARAWLFGVARHTIRSTTRRDGRHGAVAVRLAEEPPRRVADELPDLVACRADIAAAWPSLSALHQEVIALAVLDGLSAPEGATVLGISPTAFRLRLSRARRALRRLVEPAPRDEPAASDGPTSGGLSTTRSPR